MPVTIVTVHNKYAVAMRNEDVNTLVPLYDELASFGDIARRLIVKRRQNSGGLLGYTLGRGDLGQFQFYINEFGEISQWAFFDDTEKTKLQLELLIEECVKELL